MEILVAYCADCDLVFDFKNHEKCPECGEVPMELTATSKSRPTRLAPDRAKRAAKSNPSAFKRSKSGAAGKA